MENNNNIHIVVENNLCTGCGACKVACAHKIISINKTNIGRLFADIDTDKCTNCGICLDICPGYDLKNNVLLENTDPFTGNIKNTYTGISTTPVIYENSQSGGLVTECLSFLFDTKQINAAVVCTSDYGIKRPVISARIVTDKNELLLSQGSQYVQVDMVSILEKLVNIDKVAFVGLPCHLQGVIALQKKFRKFQNIIYKFGLICDRSFSEANSDVILKIYWKKKIYWRNKTQYHNYKTAPVVIEGEDGSSCNVPALARHLLKDYFTPPRCQICFDKLNIHADIVFGDPWGMSNIDYKNGESLIITRTDTGEDLIRKLIQEKRVKLNTASFNEVLKGQHIEKRKQQVKAYSEIYTQNKWLLPEYMNKINLPAASTISYSRSQKLIFDYLKLEKSSRDEIIYTVERKLKLKILKSRIKQILRLPVRILKIIIK
jgi:coenzyme F420 hydrogenase subunit beta